MSMRPEDEDVEGGEAVAVTEMVPAEERDDLKTDEPLDEPTADVVSSDAAVQLSEPAELRAAIEALLFTSPEPLTIRKLAQALGDLDQKTVRGALEELAAAYDAERRGFQIVEVAGGFQMATRERFAEFVLRLGTKKKPPSLSGATLETLAIIAYRQPVIRAEVESIRGVESSGTIRNLLDLGLIEVVGRKEVLGRPPLYGTTEKFLRTFGLRKLSELPSIRGLKERLNEVKAEEAKDQVEAADSDASAAAEPAPGAPAAADAADSPDPIDNSALAEAMDASDEAQTEEPQA